MALKYFAGNLLKFHELKEISDTIPERKAFQHKFHRKTVSCDGRTGVCSFSIPLRDGAECSKEEGGHSIFYGLGVSGWSTQSPSDLLSGMAFLVSVIDRVHVWAGRLGRFFP